MDGMDGWMKREERKTGEPASHNQTNPLIHSPCSQTGTGPPPPQSRPPPRRGRRGAGGTASLLMEREGEVWLGKKRGRAAFSRRAAFRLRGLPHRGPHSDSPSTRPWTCDKGVCDRRDAKHPSPAGPAWAPRARARRAWGPALARKSEKERKMARPARSPLSLTLDKKKNTKRQNNNPTKNNHHVRVSPFFLWPRARVRRRPTRHSQWVAGGRPGGRAWARREGGERGKRGDRRRRRCPLPAGAPTSPAAAPRGGRADAVSMPPPPAAACWRPASCIPADGVAADGGQGGGRRGGISRRGERRRAGPSAAAARCSPHCRPHAAFPRLHPGRPRDGKSARVMPPLSAGTWAGVRPVQAAAGRASKGEGRPAAPIASGPFRLFRRASLPSRRLGRRDARPARPGGVARAVCPAHSGRCRSVWDGVSRA
jgi:hypothetical protein